MIGLHVDTHRKEKEGTTLAITVYSSEIIRFYFTQKCRAMISLYWGGHVSSSRSCCLTAVSRSNILGFGISGVRKYNKNSVSLSPDVF